MKDINILESETASGLKYWSKDMEDNGKIIMNTRQIVSAVSAQLRLEYGSKGFKKQEFIVLV